MPPSFEASKRDLARQQLRHGRLPEVGDSRRCRPEALEHRVELHAQPGRDRHDVRARHRRRHGGAPGRGVRARRREGRACASSRSAARCSARPSQMLTERTGGSDLAMLETTATPRRRRVPAQRLQVVRLQRQRRGVRRAGQARRARSTASRGIAPFLVLLDRRDGTRNGVRIRRLKDKLGTQAVASAEVEFVDAEAFLLAPSGAAVAADGGRSGRRRHGPAHG